jgi:hypothetical protein
MTTRTLLRAAAVVLALTAGAPAARAQSPIKLGIAGGAAMPVGNTADLTTTGYNGTVTLALNAPLLPVGLRFDGMFNELRGADEPLGSQPNLSVSSVNANLTYTLLPLPIGRLYVIGGAGYYRTEFDDDRETQGDVGFNGGAGIRFGSGGRQLFVEGRYHRANTGGNGTIEIVPITIGFLF